MINPNDADKTLRDVLVRGTKSRGEIWGSKKEAYRLLKTKGKFTPWDDRVLRIDAVSIIILAIT